MRNIDVRQITEVVSQLCIQANTVLRRDVLGALKDALKRERKALARRILEVIIQNASVASSEGLPICQDTGVPIVFAELGSDVKVVGGSLKDAIDRGLIRGYKKGRLRKSIVEDPIKRSGTPKFGPGVIHFDLTRGNRLKLTVLPKGFGCENKSKVRMLRPTAGVGEIKAFVVEVVKEAGPDACPPFVVGVGIGGTQDEATRLAKTTLLRPINRVNPNRDIARLEKDILKEINRLNLGPMGLGGKTTALGVNILTHPTHIAGLPCAVNISCHALRSASRTL